MTWIVVVLTSEFFWGIIVGLSLSIVGAKIQIELARKAHTEIQNDEIKTLCTDIIRNLIRVTEDIAEARRRSRVIHNDLLMLLDVEIGVFSRVRERTIYLSEDERMKVRKYVTDCALRRAEIGIKLAAFSDRHNFANNLQLNDDVDNSSKVFAEAEVLLSDANSSVDELISMVTKGESIISLLAAKSP